MPIARISLYEGRTKEQKRELAEEITQSMVRIIGCTRESVNIIYDDIPRADWVIGGAPETAVAKSG